MLMHLDPWAREHDRPPRRIDGDEGEYQAGEDLGIPVGQQERLDPPDLRGDPDPELYVRLLSRPSECLGPNADGDGPAAKVVGCRDEVVDRACCIGHADLDVSSQSGVLVVSIAAMAEEDSKVNHS